MEIKAICNLDLRTMQALTHLWLYKKANPKKRMIFWTVVYAFLAVVIIGEMYLFGADTTLWVLLFLNIVIYLLGCYLYFVLPKIHYSALEKMKNIVNEYTFCEGALMITTKGTEYNGETEIKYSLIVKVYETTNYLFIFQNKSQVYVVDKSTIIGGTADELRTKIKNAISGKYIVCNY